MHSHFQWSILFLITGFLITNRSVYAANPVKRFESKDVVIDPFGSSGGFSITKKDALAASVNLSTLTLSFLPVIDSDGNAWNIAPFSWLSIEEKTMGGANQTMLSMQGQTDGNKKPFLRWTNDLYLYDLDAYIRTSTLKFSIHLDHWAFTSFNADSKVTLSLQIKAKHLGRDRTDFFEMSSNQEKRTHLQTSSRMFQFIAGFMNCSSTAIRNGNETVDVSFALDFHGSSPVFQIQFPGPFITMDYDPFIIMGEWQDPNTTPSVLAPGEWGFNLIFFGSLFFAGFISWIIYCCGCKNENKDVPAPSVTSQTTVEGIEIH